MSVFKFPVLKIYKFVLKSYNLIIQPNMEHINRKKWIPINTEMPSVLKRHQFSGNVLSCNYGNVHKQIFFMTVVMYWNCIHMFLEMPTIQICKFYILSLLVILCTPLQDIMLQET